MKNYGQFAAACAAVVVGVLTAGSLSAAQVAKFVEYVETDGKRPDIGCYECQDVRGLMLLVR